MTTLRSQAQAAGLDTPERREAVAQTLAKIETNGIRYVRLAHPDLMGVLRGRMIAAQSLAQLFETGHSFGCRLLLADLDGEVHPSVQLGETYDYGNFYLLPDPTTLVQLPWSPESCVILADPYLPDGRPAVSGRLALKRALQLAGQANLDLRIGMELEGTLLPMDEHAKVSPKHHLFSTLGQGWAATWLQPVWAALEQMDIQLTAFANEFSEGQVEFNLAPKSALQAADNLVLMKLAVRELLMNTGYGLTFMAKGSNQPDTLPNGLHIHQSSLDADGQNRFYQPSAARGLAPTLLHFIGGQLKYARWIAVWSTPTITGYRRYRPGTWAPTSVTWSLDNRTTMLRVMPDRDAATRVENRLPDSAANPYLALTAMIIAGTLGIKQQLDPGPAALGYATQATTSLPQNIGAAAEILSEPSDFHDVLDPDLITAYRGLLLQAVEHLEAYVTDWEIAKYRDIL